MNTPAFLLALLPEHLLLAGLVALLLLQLKAGPHRAALPLALAAVAAAALAATALALQGYAAAPFPGHFSVTPATLLPKALVLALALPVLLMARADFGGPAAAQATEPSTAPGTDPGTDRMGLEFAALLLASLYGACLMQSADSFLTLFLGLEVLSLPVYVLVLLAWRRPQCAEAALKYLVLGGTGSACLLMGVSLLAGAGAATGPASGSLALAAFAQALASTSPSALQSAGLVLIVVAFFLKAAVVPFHGWAPDAYEAASVPVTAYMAVIVKAAVLLAAVRLFGETVLRSPMLELLVVLPLASVAWGNLAALRQTSLRRTIAYSSVAHAGYLFLVLLGAPAGRLQAVTFYLLSYGLLNLLALAALPLADDDHRRDSLDALKGLYHRAPFAALSLGVAMLSLAGIPPFPGFVAKFLVFKNAVAAGHVGVAVAGLLGSYLGIYFYLRVLQFMFMSPDTPALPSTLAAADGAGAARRWATAASLGCLVAALAVALFPGWVLARL